MPRAHIGVLILVACLFGSDLSTRPALPGGASLALASSGDAAGGSGNGSALGYGFGASLDQPFQAVGSQALASVFFFNLSQQDAWGFGVPLGGEGCSFFVNILDDKGRLVRRPRVPCPLASTSPQASPVGFYSLPAGTFRRFDVPLPLAYASSETGDPDGTLLPGGLYTLQATQLFEGPGPGGSAFGFLPFQGGDPEARVPFRIFQCTQSAGPLPVRELVQGSFSGYRNNDPTFSGEDLVLRTGQAGLQFWFQHTAPLLSPPPPPAVDLSQEMVIVSIAGPRPNGRSSLRITSVWESPCQLVVTVQETTFPVGVDVLSSPFDIVAVPRSVKEVVFLHLRASVITIVPQLSSQCPGAVGSCP